MYRGVNEAVLEHFPYKIVGKVYTNVLTKKEKKKKRNYIKRMFFLTPLITVD